MTTTFPRRALLAGATAFLGASALPAWAQTAPQRLPPVRSELTAGQLTVEVIDYSPQFLAWYEAARSEPSAEARFALWQVHYGRAAVPPGPRGEAMARQLVDAAWPRYSEAAPAARAGAAGMSVDTAAVLGSVARELGMTAPGRMQLVTMIGAFEGNAYTYRAAPDAPPTLVVPLEIPPDLLRMLIAHEGTHAIHMVVANMAGGWERSIGATVLQEGLAMHVARAVFPGHAPEFYLTNDPAWWPRAQAARRAILEGIRADLGVSAGETVMKYTMGSGNTGLQREAYATGWWIIEEMRARGMSFAQIAQISEADAPNAARDAIDGLLRA